ncbi:MAG: hypothetical protein AAGD09_10130 [Cyanobacteria bacterium P01_F01_bin.56]
MQALIISDAPQRAFELEMREQWAMGRLEYDLYRYAYLTRSQYHNTLVIQQTRPA